MRSLLHVEDAHETEPPSSWAQVTLQCVRGPSVSPVEGRQAQGQQLRQAVSRCRALGCRRRRHPTHAHGAQTFCACSRRTRPGRRGRSDDCAKAAIACKHVAIEAWQARTRTAYLCTQIKLIYSAESARLLQITSRACVLTGCDLGSESPKLPVAGPQLATLKLSELGFGAGPVALKAAPPLQARPA